jgi:ribosomal protein S18 acetylase RimI-like enzyme
VPRGYTDPIGTRPAFRRLGLARALLLEALRRLDARSVQSSHVGTGSANVAMQRCLESVGYRSHLRALAYRREFAP